MKPLSILFYGEKSREIPHTKSCGFAGVTHRDANEYDIFCELQSFLSGTDVKEKIQFEFVESSSVDSENIQELLEKHGTPILSLGDSDFLIGRPHNVNLYLKIKEILERKNSYE